MPRFWRVLIAFIELNAVKNAVLTTFMTRFWRVLIAFIELTSVKTRCQYCKRVIIPIVDAFDNNKRDTKRVINVVRTRNKRA